MATLVFLQLRAGGHPGGRPIIFRIVISDVEITTAHIERGVVVAVAGETPQAGIFVKGIATGCVRNQTEILFAAEVVDPGQGSIGLGDYIFSGSIVKITVAHNDLIS